MTEITVMKQPGGVLIPATDFDAEKLQRFKNNEVYPASIKIPRNYKFHKKVMKFFEFCFEHWKSDREFMDESGQFKVFRKELTKIAGYYDQYYTIAGEVRIEAKSISFASMEEDEFQELYSALISAAVRTIFPGCGPEVENRLLSFF